MTLSASILAADFGHLERDARAAVEAGCETVLAVTGHRSDVVEALLGDMTCVLQEEQLGTGHAVMCAREQLDGVSGSLVVLSGDTPLMREDRICVVLV